jgi:hypothetical protein
MLMAKSAPVVQCNGTAMYARRTAVPYPPENTYIIFSAVAKPAPAQIPENYSFLENIMLKF